MAEPETPEQDQAPQPMSVVKPPDNYASMTDEEKHAWAADIVAKFAEAEGK